MDEITLIATARLGLEMLVKQELQALGYADLQVSNGRIQFPATLADIARANLWLRTADRLLLKMAEFPTTTFDDLFEQSKALPWEEWITADGKFTVTATAVKSQLQSERTCQAIVKKAVVERLKTHTHTEWFPETGPAFPIHVSIHHDVALLTLDTSGVGLHKRGYRAEAGEAPLKETLAAALVMLSFWNKDRLLLDPLCGSGTILIEAALLGRNIAPGLHRSFAAEQWPAVPAQVWAEARGEAATAVNRDTPLQLLGYDSDAASITIAQQNAAKAGVGQDIQFGQKDVRDLWIDQQYGVLITNPPYGVRLADYQAMNQIYIALNKIFRKKTGWSVYVLTADPQFPHYFKRAQPDRVRKLYNGNIQVNYYQYYGEKPPYPIATVTPTSQ
ncbi:MAG TPA: class I SAM-dependent RNA methyltransferase [Chloroflexota bacterium]|nr:class I SAM-dependent RNA methyltransferase [Chloroflexota bacterium]